MDKLTRYREAVKACLLDWHAFTSRAEKDEDNKPHYVFDDERGHYLLLFTGWRGDDRDHIVYIHLRIRNGKIWVEEDGTDVGVATQLERAGVPREDIVLAFHHPETRKLGDYAVA